MPGRLELEAIPRRDFLGMAGIWAAAIAVLGSLIGMIRLPKPRLLPEAGNIFRVGKPVDFPSGSEKIVPGRNVLILSRRNGIAAVSLICTHLGCIVSRTDHGFHCPCHGSIFGPDGEVLEGPAPRGLRWWEVSLAPDGSLLVDAKREVAARTYYTA